MSRFARLQSQWLYPGLIVVVGWALMAAFAVQADLQRVPPLESPAEGISFDWVESGEMRLRVARVRFGERRRFKLQLMPDRGATDGKGVPSAFISRSSRWFFAMRGRTVPWKGVDVPVVGWAARVEEWPDVDVWIVGPFVFHD